MKTCSHIHTPVFRLRSGEFDVCILVIENFSAPAKQGNTLLSVGGMRVLRACRDFLVHTPRNRRRCLLPFFPMTHTHPKIQYAFHGTASNTGSHSQLDLSLQMEQSRILDSKLSFVLFLAVVCAQLCVVSPTQTHGNQ